MPKNKPPEQSHDDVNPSQPDTGSLLNSILTSSHPDFNDPLKAGFVRLEDLEYEDDDPTKKPPGFPPNGGAV